MPISTRSCHPMTTRSVLLSIHLVLGLLLPTLAEAQTRGASSVAPPARFADPQRLAKLSAAFPEIDRVMRAFAERSRVPGIAYGIIVDGRLVHVGTRGVRDVSIAARRWTRRPCSASRR